MRDARRIAVIIPGGIGTGKNNLGVPVLERIISLLSDRFDITVFQLYPRNKGFSVDKFTLVDAYSRFPVIKIIKLLIAFVRHHRMSRFQSVHGFWVLPGGWLAVILGKLFRIKSIVSVLGGDAISLPEISYGQLAKPLYRTLIFWSLRRADTVIALTEYLVNNLRLAGFVRDDIQIIPWGIDINQFYFTERPLADPVRFLHVGNLYPVKDQETLLRAFRIIRDHVPARLTIIGEGILHDKLSQLIDNLQLSRDVGIHHPVSYKELPAFYHQADVLLHTSLSEGQCEVVTEAMSAGLLVCGTKVGLMYDLPECCITVNPRDYRGLANAVLDSFRNQDVLVARRLRARVWSESHSILWTVEKVAEIYHT